MTNSASLTIVEIIEYDEVLVFTVVEGDCQETIAKIMPMLDPNSELDLHATWYTSSWQITARKDEDKVYATVRPFNPEYFIGRVMAETTELSILDQLVGE